MPTKWHDKDIAATLQVERVAAIPFLFQPYQQAWLFFQLKGILDTCDFCHESLIHLQTLLNG